MNSPHHYFYFTVLTIFLSIAVLFGKLKLRSPNKEIFLSASFGISGYFFALLGVMEGDASLLYWPNVICSVLSFLLTYLLFFKACCIFGGIDFDEDKPERRYSMTELKQKWKRETDRGLMLAQLIGVLLMLVLPFYFAPKTTFFLMNHLSN
jgi:hypothetical protein